MSPRMRLSGRALMTPIESDAGACDPQVADRRSWGSALRESVRRPSLVRSATAAGVVGTTLLIANLGVSLVNGPVTLSLAVKVFLTYAVPWGNATVGIAIGLREQGT